VRIGADEMREYDDYDGESIRLYTPVLQRVIILAAVIIAVPVMMWTITTFVRSYVARPKAPLLEHVASTAAPTRIPLIAPPPSPAPPAAAQSTVRGDGAASDAPNAEIGTGSANSLPDSSPSPAAATGPSTASLQVPPLRASSPASPAPAAADASTVNAAVATATMTGSVPRPPQAPRSTDNTTPSSALSSSDRGIAWPNPNATSPPDFTAPRLAPPPPPPARTAAAEILPTDNPIRGPVPLPRQRPGTFAVATTAAGGPVPLPRARPGEASAADTGAAVEIPGGRSELESVH
jgi:hypothetical protein